MHPLPRLPARDSSGVAEVLLVTRGEHEAVSRARGQRRVGSCDNKACVRLDDALAESHFVPGRARHYMYVACGPILLAAKQVHEAVNLFPVVAIAVG